MPGSRSKSSCWTSREASSALLGLLTVPEARRNLQVLVADVTEGIGYVTPVPAFGQARFAASRSSVAQASGT